MNKVSLSLLLFVFAHALLGQTVTQLKDDCQSEEHKGVLYKMVEQMPSFEGCHEESDPNGHDCTNIKFSAFIRNHPLYKTLLDDHKPSGSMYLNFVVETNGCLSNINVRRDICKGCGETVAQIIATSPRWKSGMTNGEAVRVMKNIELEIPHE